MPELPEVEVLVRQLAQVLPGMTVRGLEILRARTLRPTRERELKRALVGSTFQKVTRRGKYLIFDLRKSDSSVGIRLLGHLGMTGRMYLQREGKCLPKHAAVALRFDRARLVFEDMRGFGRLTLDTTPLARLGPEPLDDSFTVVCLQEALIRSRQPVKVKLLDQALVAGVGNIYASEALFRAGISPRLASDRLTRGQVKRLRTSLRRVITEAIKFGSKVTFDWESGRDRLFFHGRADESGDALEERLRVYDREAQPCRRCRTPVRRIVQACRSTFYCPRCQSI